MEANDNFREFFRSFCNPVDIGHVEAGLCAPNNIHILKKQTDHDGVLADLHFSPTEDARQNRDEAKNPKRFVTGIRQSTLKTTVNDNYHSDIIRKT